MTVLIKSLLVSSKYRLLKPIKCSNTPNKGQNNALSSSEHCSRLSDQKWTYTITESKYNCTVCYLTSHYNHSELLTKCNLLISLTSYCSSHSVPSYCQCHGRHLNSSQLPEAIIWHKNMNTCDLTWITLTVQNVLA